MHLLLLLSVALAAANGASALPSPFGFRPSLQSADDVATPDAAPINTNTSSACTGCTNLGNFADPRPAVFASDPTVTVQNGTYAGVYLAGVAAGDTLSGIGVAHPQELFLGMPYAQQPTGERRWARPVPLDSTWSGVLPAKRYSVHCFGVGTDDDYNPPYITYAMGEECLTVNVVRPKGVVKGSKAPVVAWIHGGGFQFGGSGDRRYNGSWIVDRSVEVGSPIIFTSFNYRKGVMGFPNGKAAVEAGVQNLGLYDQRLALQWLRENIASFGGDPDKVTIMGESAGGASIFLQYTAFGGRDDKLFRGAIAQSGYWATPAARPVSSAGRFDAAWAAFTAALNCPASPGPASFACLRTVPFETLRAAIRTVAAPAGQWNPTVDGDLVADDLQVSFAKGRFVSRAALLATANSDEGSAFGVRGIANETVLVAAVRAAGSLSEAGVNNATALAALLAAYPDDEDVHCPFSAGDGLVTTGAMDRRSMSIFGDAVMVGPRRYAARAVAAAGGKVYAGRFDQLAAGLPIDVGATHFQEVSYVFRNPLDSQNPLGRSPRDAALAAEMNAYWVGFVARQDPNAFKLGSSVRWPSYDDKKKILRFRRTGAGGTTEEEVDTWREDGINVLMDMRLQGFSA